MNSNNMETAIIGSTSETVDAFQHAYALDLGVVLSIGVSRLTRDISLKSRRIPHLDGFVIRRRDEEHVIG
jgi:hypothetical protein